MSKSTHMEEIGELRAEIQGLKSELRRLAGLLTAEESGTEERDQPPQDLAERTGRRGMFKVAGAAALGAVGMKLVNTAPAMAASGNGGDVQLGEVNTCSATTTVSTSAGSGLLGTINQDQSGLIGEFAAGVIGDVAGTTGVIGLSQSVNGVYGVAQGFSGITGYTAGVLGEGDSIDGTIGLSQSTNGARGVSVGPSGLPFANAGVMGDSTTNPGVLGLSVSNTGVHGVSAGPSGIPNIIAGVIGGSSVNPGVAGLSGGDAGVLGMTLGNGSAAFNGTDGSPAGGYGAQIVSLNGVGIYAETYDATNPNPAVQAESSGTGPALLATTTPNATSPVVQATSGSELPAVQAVGEAIPSGGAVAVAGNGAALSVQGAASFSRSGVTKLSSVASSVVVKVPGGLTSSSYVLATLQTNTAALAVQAVVPDASSGKITIHFTASAPSGTKVAWFVLD